LFCQFEFCLGCEKFICKNCSHLELDITTILLKLALNTNQSVNLGCDIITLGSVWTKTFKIVPPIMKLTWNEENKHVNSMWRNVSYSRNLQYHKFMCLHIQLLGHNYGFISDEVDMFADCGQSKSRFCLRWVVWVKLVGNRAFWGIIFWKLEFGWERKIEDTKMWWKIVNQYRKVNVWPRKGRKGWGIIAVNKYKKLQNQNPRVILRAPEEYVYSPPRGNRHRTELYG
jgi:hypothetical protein